MSDAVIWFFICLIVYRGFCRWAKLEPFPLVQININNYRDCDDA